MFWVIVAAMAVVVGGAALVALGGGGVLPEAVPDRMTPRLPEDRPLARHDVDGLRLPMALRGYRMDEVDDVLDRLGAELALRDSRIAELEAAAVVRGAVEAAPDLAVQDETLPGLEAFAAVVERPAPTADAPTADAPAEAAAAGDEQAEQQAAEEPDGPAADAAAGADLEKKQK
ncbi:DivIVA domain-containing protein [Kitasatospora sp. NPDC059571]|uniref:DivIVA domain-containing protein n=1 Tax=Kitasatospora sp. NPDC059571 TaxID=3346871 RepID=UPI0036C1A11F